MQHWLLRVCCGSRQEVA